MTTKKIQEVICISSKNIGCYKKCIQDTLSNKFIRNFTPNIGHVFGIENWQMISNPKCDDYGQLLFKIEAELKILNPKVGDVYNAIVEDMNSDGCNAIFVHLQDAESVLAMIDITTTDEYCAVKGHNTMNFVLPEKCKEPDYYPRQIKIGDIVRICITNIQVRGNECAILAKFSGKSNDKKPKKDKKSKPKKDKKSKNS